MQLADRLTISGIAVIMGLVALFAYVAANPIFSGWIDILFAELIFAAVYLLAVTTLQRRYQRSIA